MMDWLLAGGIGDAGVLTWTASPTVRLVVLALGAIAMGLALMPGRTRRSPLMKGIEAVLWLGAVGVLCVAALGPTWVDDAGRQEPGPLVVLVDGSSSMGVVEEGRTRGEALASRLAEVVSLTSAAGPVDVYTFDEDLRSGPPVELDGRGTDLGVALEAISDRYLGQRTRGVVVLTDGADRGALRRSVREASADGALDPGLAPPLPGPLTLVQVGQLDDV
ncbi:MAG: hypothetical protein VX265_02935, partial [Myxococcota bacterium]|nr:hypothetical protein [Myxococcota bacterium]